MFHSLEYEKFRDAKNKGMIIHYVPKDNCVGFEVLMDNGEIINGVAEDQIKNLKIDDVIQAERRFFCRLDAVQNDVYKFWFTHK